MLFPLDLVVLEHKALLHKHISCCSDFTTINPRNTDSFRQINDYGSDHLKLMSLFMSCQSTSHRLQ